MIVVVLIGLYFGLRIYDKHRTEKDLALLEQGFTYGYTSAVLQIMNISDTCQPFPVYVGNETRTLISVDCLNLG